MPEPAASTPEPLFPNKSFPLFVGSTICLFVSFLLLGDPTVGGQLRLPPPWVWLPSFAVLSSGIYYCVTFVRRAGVNLPIFVSFLAHLAIACLLLRFSKNDW